MGSPVENLAPPISVEPKRDTGTKSGRSCGWPFNRVGASRDGSTRKRLRALSSRVESTGKKSFSGSWLVTVPETDTGG
jgi:hypothetical protein